MQKPGSLKLKFLSIAAGVGILASTAMPALAASTLPISYHDWDGFTDFATGQFSNGARLGFTNQGQAAITGWNGATQATWQSSVYHPAMPVTKIVASWQADTPGAAWIETKLSVHVNNTWSDWYNMGKWALNTTAINRSSIVPDQQDDNGAVYQDTYYTNDGQSVDAYKIEEVMHGSGNDQPVVRQLAVTASDPTVATQTPVSATTMTKTIDLNVPQYSQYVHNGEYTMLDGGGSAWCSPTSVSMVLQYFGKQPTTQQVVNLPADPVFDANHRVDGIVDYAAWHIFDYGNKNTGDWPFNMAYAASFGMDTSVRQYTSLRDLEAWVRQGVPVVVTTAWDNTSSDPSQHLDGASIAKTPGHLMVVRGFTQDGRVIANDPATPSGDADVRHVYNRTQFEHLWQTTADGTVYIVKPQR